MQREGGGDTIEVVTFWENIRNSKTRCTQECQKKREKVKGTFLLTVFAPRERARKIPAMKNLSLSVSGLVT